MIVLGLVLAVLMGLALGTLGGGGSTLTVPIFVYVLGFEAKRAIAMSFPVVGVTSLVGAASHWRQGNVRWGTALLFGPLLMAGSFLSARVLAPLVSGRTQLVLLAMVMIASSLSMLRSAGRTHPESEVTTRPLWGLLPVGLSVGALTGLVGIGGGFLIVPALVLFVGMPMKHAIGTSLLVIAMNTAAGFAGYAGRVEIAWGFLATFTAVAVVGILAGSVLAKRATPAQLKRAFAVFLLVVGALMLVRG